MSESSRVAEALRFAQQRFSDLSKIEVIREWTLSQPVERISDDVVMYDPILVATLNTSELIAAIVKAANDWAFTPESPEMIDVTAQRDELLDLVGWAIDRIAKEKTPSDSWEFIDELRAKRNAIVAGKKR